MGHGTGCVLELCSVAGLDGYNLGIHVVKRTHGARRWRVWHKWCVCVCVCVCVCMCVCVYVPRFTTDRKTSRTTSRTALLSLRSFLSPLFLLCSCFCGSHCVCVCVYVISPPNPQGALTWATKECGLVRCVS